MGEREPNPYRELAQDLDMAVKPLIGLSVGDDIYKLKEALGELPQETKNAIIHLTKILENK